MGGRDQPGGVKEAREGLSGSPPTVAPPATRAWRLRGGGPTAEEEGEGATTGSTAALGGGATLEDDDVAGDSSGGSRWRPSPSDEQRLTLAMELAVGLM